MKIFKRQSYDSYLFISELLDVFCMAGVHQQPEQSNYLDEGQILNLLTCEHLATPIHPKTHKACCTENAKRSSRLYATFINSNKLMIVFQVSFGAIHAVAGCLTISYPS